MYMGGTLIAHRRCIPVWRIANRIVSHYIDTSFNWYPNIHIRFILQEKKTLPWTRYMNLSSILHHHGTYEEILDIQSAVDGDTANCVTRNTSQGAHNENTLDSWVTAGLMVGWGSAMHPHTGTCACMHACTHTYVLSMKHHHSTVSSLTY